MTGPEPSPAAPPQPRHGLGCLLVIAVFIAAFATIRLGAKGSAGAALGLFGALGAGLAAMLVFAPVRGRLPRWAVLLALVWTASGAAILHSIVRDQEAEAAREAAARPRVEQARALLKAEKYDEAARVAYAALESLQGSDPSWEEALQVRNGAWRLRALGLEPKLAAAIEEARGRLRDANDLAAAEEALRFADDHTLRDAPSHATASALFAAVGEAAAPGREDAVLLGLDDAALAALQADGTLPAAPLSADADVDGALRRRLAARRGEAGRLVAEARARRDAAIAKERAELAEQYRYGLGITKARFEAHRGTDESFQPHDAGLSRVWVWRTGSDKDPVSHSRYYDVAADGSIEGLSVYVHDVEKLATKDDTSRRVVLGLLFVTNVMLAKEGVDAERVAKEFVDLIQSARSGETSREVEGVTIRARPLDIAGVKGIRLDAGHWPEEMERGLTPDGKRVP